MTPGLVDIHRVMEQTGGEMFDVKNVASLRRGFWRAAAEDQDAVYAGVLAHTSANGAEGKPHKLDVRLAPSFEGRRVTAYNILRLRDGYYFGP